MATDRELFFPDRFKTAAAYYTEGRPHYPKLLSRRVAESIGLDRKHTVIDIGTGPGFLAIDFAAHAGSVRALDPSPDMLAVAKDNAAKAEVRVEFIQGSSYDLGPGSGRFRLAAFGRSFHWTDRRETLKTLDRLIETGGAVALFSDKFPELPENAWRAGFVAIIDKYAAEDPARAELRTDGAHETHLLASAFSHLERLAVLERRFTPLEHLVNRALSYSRAWHGSPGSRVQDLAVEVRRALLPFAGSDGKIEEIVEGHALIARRPGEVPGV